MRRPVVGTALLALVLITAPASADPSDPSVPSRGDVREAERRAETAADDVDAIQARIDEANASLEAAAIAAQQASEAYNGARYRLAEARKAERQAAKESRRAARALAVVKRDYRGAVLTTFVGNNPDLAAFNAMLDADGLPSLLDRDATAEIVQAEFEEKRTAYETAAEEAADAEEAAEDAAADAADAAADAEQAKQDAQNAVAAAGAAVESVRAEKTRLLRRLARLEGISVALAEERQAALELQAQQQAELEAQQQAQELAEEQAELEAQQQAEEEAEPEQEQPEQQPDTGSDSDSDSDSGSDSEPDPTPPPSDQGGASAAIAFARAQLGEPYVWAAAGPGSWDCSGLTMAAWAAGGKSLPHYSVAQYEQSTPISAGELKPGDLVFWGSSSSASSIYHVALYVGDGRIIHAPRTGRPVTEESLYYWIPPTHYARP